MLKKLIGIYVLLCLSIGVVIAPGFWWEKSKVPSLKQKDFWKNVGNDKYVMVEFYTKACPYCEELYPKMNRIYDEFTGPNSKRKDILFFKVDGEECPKIADSLAITAFPMIYTFKPKDQRFPDKYRFDNTYSDIKGYILALPVLGGDKTSKAESQTTQASIDAAEKKVKLLEARLKEMEKKEEQIVLGTKQKSGDSKNSSIGEGQPTAASELGIDVLQDVLKKHRRMVKKSVTSLQKGIAESFARGPKIAHQDSSKSEKHQETEVSDDDDEEVVDYDYKHAWIVRISLFLVIGYSLAIMVDRMRSLDSTGKNTRI
jgi:thiol-disulfide isomerase/thioredoxin